MNLEQLEARRDELYAELEEIEEEIAWQTLDHYDND